MSTEPVFLDLYGVVQSSRADNTSLSVRVVKLMEEVGELAANILAAEGLPNASASANAEGVPEEAADVLICVIDILIKSGYSVELLNQLIPIKVAKWDRKMGRLPHAPDVCTIVGTDRSLGNRLLHITRQQARVGS